MERADDVNRKGYRNLKIYQEAHVLVKAVYSATERFPKSEIFGLTSQMRRCAVSVVANICEGYARTSKREFLQFLSVARGSLAELEYYLELSLELDYLSSSEYEKFEAQRTTAGALLGGFTRRLRNDSSQ